MPTTELAPRILSIDDDPDISALIRILLQQEGYQVSSFLDGREALKQLDAGMLQPDLILLDLDMPGLDGYGCLKELQTRPQWSLIPVVILTASIEDANRLKAFQLGAVGFLEKPVAADTLPEQIERFLAVRKHWRQNFEQPQAEPAAGAPAEPGGFAGFKQLLQQQMGRELPEPLAPGQLYQLCESLDISASQLARTLSA
ncbi:MAG: two-component system response regulator [Candidatus Sericytochromatia bacterium]